MICNDRFRITISLPNVNRIRECLPIIRAINMSPPPPPFLPPPPPPKPPRPPPLFLAAKYKFSEILGQIFTTHYSCCPNKFYQPSESEGKLSFNAVSIFGGNKDGSLTLSSLPSRNCRKGPRLPKLFNILAFRTEPGTSTKDTPSNSSMFRSFMVFSSNCCTIFRTIRTPWQETDALFESSVTHDVENPVHASLTFSAVAASIVSTIHNAQITNVRQTCKRRRPIPGMPNQSMIRRFRKQTSRNENVWAPPSKTTRVLLSLSRLWTLPYGNRKPVKGIPRVNNTVKLRNLRRRFECCSVRAYNSHLYRSTWRSVIVLRKKQGEQASVRWLPFSALAVH